MSTTIPYDPSLVLGNLIHENDIKQLEAIQAAEEPVNAAQNRLNDSIQAKHKLDMTLQEMVEMNVDVNDLDDFRDSIQKVGESITENASDYGKAVLKAQKDVAKLKANISLSKLKLLKILNSLPIVIELSPSKDSLELILFME